MKIPCLKVPDVIWNSLFGSTQLQVNIWITLLRVSLIGSANCQMNFLTWKYLISYQRLSFPGWKPQISYEFPCFEVPDFLWISLIGLPNFISNCHISYEIPCLEVPNFIWISLREVPNSYEHVKFPGWRAKFYTNILVWKYQISEERNEIAKFNLKFLDWKCKFSRQFPCLEVPHFISNCQISFEFRCLQVLSAI